MPAITTGVLMTYARVSQVTGSVMETWTVLMLVMSLPAQVSALSRLFSRSRDYEIRYLNHRIVSSSIGSIIERFKVAEIIK